ncbi:hypothetical protein B0H11DRAFT_1902415 [Mycena galericulata]|nr:hypothetical protein B0H11DRAFT_1902415 [Mycena galericulata]
MNKKALHDQVNAHRKLRKDEVLLKLRDYKIPNKPDKLQAVLDALQRYNQTSSLSRIELPRCAGQMTQIEPERTYNYQNYISDTVPIFPGRKELELNVNGFNWPEYIAVLSGPQDARKDVEDWGKMREAIPGCPNGSRTSHWGGKGADGRKAAMSRGRAGMEEQGSMGDTPKGRGSGKKAQGTGRGHEPHLSQGTQVQSSGKHRLHTPPQSARVPPETSGPINRWFPVANLWHPSAK